MANAPQASELSYVPQMNASPLLAKESIYDETISYFPNIFPTFEKANPTP
jgi:hypothetical protein